MKAHLREVRAKDEDGKTKVIYLLGGSLDPNAVRGSLAPNALMSSSACDWELSPSPRGLWEHKGLAR